MPSRPVPKTSSTPLSGRPVRGSRTGRPVMALLDLLGRRGALRILWELRDGHGQSFRLLQESAGGMSPSVLNDRVKELREAAIIELRPGGYALTESGADLLKRLKPIRQWADNQAASLAAQPDEAGTAPESAPASVPHKAPPKASRRTDPVTSPAKK